MPGQSLGSQHRNPEIVGPSFLTTIDALPQSHSGRKGRPLAAWCRIWRSTPTLSFVILGSGFRRDVAQPGSALAWGARGREFKSRRPDHLLIQVGGGAGVRGSPPPLAFRPGTPRRGG